MWRSLNKPTSRYTSFLTSRICWDFSATNFKYRKLTQSATTKITFMVTEPDPRSPGVMGLPLIQVQHFEDDQIGHQNDTVERYKQQSHVPQPDAQLRLADLHNLEQD